ncbi:uncharacterized protein [Symphalangus syndactylus]|uniref:uncharacterized protein n=1 Tax=Symphalangus syndactylus TaxID=9590 RepID=UPI00300765D5
MTIPPEDLTPGTQSTVIYQGFQLCHVLPVWPWENSSLFLSLIVVIYAHTRERNPRGGHQSRALCAEEIYPVKCRKAPAPPDRVLPPRRGPSRPSPPEAPGTRLARRSRSSKSEWGRRVAAAAPGGGERGPRTRAQLRKRRTGARALLRCSRASPRPPLPLCPRGRGAGDPRGGSRSSTAGAAQPAALVPQHSWVTDSDRRDLAAPGTLATWRTSARRRQTPLGKLRGRALEPRATRALPTFPGRRCPGPCVGSSWPVGIHLKMNYCWPGGSHNIIVTAYTLLNLIISVLYCHHFI